MRPNQRLLEGDDVKTKLSADKKLLVVGDRNYVFVARAAPRCELCAFFRPPISCRYLRLRLPMVCDTAYADVANDGYWEKLT